jgi:hypothetical protein
MWPFPKKETNTHSGAGLQAGVIEPIIEPLGDVASVMNGLAGSIEAAMRKHLDINNLNTEQQQGGHFGTEFNLSTTVGVMKGLYVQEPWVYATAELIAKTMSTVPYRVRNKITKEIDTTHPMNKILVAGSQITDYKTTDWAGYADLTLGGNYFRILSEDYKYFYHVPVEYTEIVLNERFKAGDMTAPPFAGIRINGAVGTMGMKPRFIDWKYVIHHKLPNPYNPFFGLSMYAAAARPIILDRHKNEFELAFYLRGATHAGVIETTEDLPKKRLDRLMRSFEQSYTGRRNWWRTLWLPKNAKWVSNGMTMNEMQHLEGLRENRLTLLAVLGIPSAMVGIVQDVNRSTAEIQEQAFWNNTIIPLSHFIAAGWNHSYLVQTVFKGEISIEPDYSGIRAVEGSVITKGEQTEAAKDALTVNEIRTDIWGYPPLKDPRGDLFISQLKSISLAANLYGNVPGSDPDAEDTDEGEEGDRTEITLEQGDNDHTHQAEVDEDGNGKTISMSSDIDEHIHELVGVEQEDGSVVVTVSPAGSDDHVHPDVVLQSEKSMANFAFLKAKNEATTDQDRLEKTQSEKYLGAFRIYVRLLLDQTVEALTKGKAVSNHLLALKSERMSLYEVKCVQVLYETMDKAFTSGLANSRSFTAIKIKGPRFTPTDEQAIEVLRRDREEGKRRRLRERSLERFLGFDDTATDSILLSIERGLEEGQTFQEIAKTIEKTFGENYRDQAFTITRTEVLHAVSEGLAFEMEVLADIFTKVEKQWFHVGDTATNPDARQWHKEFENQMKKPPEYLYVSPETGAKLRYPRDPNGGAKENINCFVGETEINSHSVLNLYRRIYCGPIVTIKMSSGKSISGTPNHPMLTSKGWVTLGSLDKSHKLVKAKVIDGVFPADDKIGSIPVSFSQFFASSLQSGNNERVAGSVMDFHGDGMNTDVEVVFKDSLLVDRLVANGTETVAKINFQRTRLSEGIGLGNSRLDKPVSGVSSSDRIMGKSYLLSSTFRRHLGPFQNLSLTPASPLQIQNAKSSGQSDSGYTESLSQFVDTNSFIDVELVDIEDISITENALRHVYNLSTVNEMYLVEGMVTHNCRCSLVTTVADGAISRAPEILE